MFYSDIKHVLTGRISSALAGRSFSGEVGSEGAAASPGLIFLVLRLRTPTTQFRFLSDTALAAPPGCRHQSRLAASQFTTSAGDLEAEGGEERRDAQIITVAASASTPVSSH